MSQTTDPFEFLKSLWGPLGVPMPGMMAPTLNVSDIDKRIADLKSVENWLNLNMNVLKMTIQGLELQRSTVSAMQSGIEGATRIMQGVGTSGADNASPFGGAGSAWPFGTPGSAGSSPPFGAGEGSQFGASGAPQFGAGAAPQFGAGAAPAGSPGDAWWTVLQQAQEAAERLRNAAMPGAAPGDKPKG